MFVVANECAVVVGVVWVGGWVFWGGGLPVGYHPCLSVGYHPCPVCLAAVCYCLDPG